MKVSYLRIFFKIILLAGLLLDGSQAYSLTICESNAVRYSYKTFPKNEIYLEEGVAVSISPIRIGTATLSGYVVSSGRLPTGITLNSSNGVLSGKPAAVTPNSDVVITYKAGTTSCQTKININVDYL